MCFWWGRIHARGPKELCETKGYEGDFLDSQPAFDALLAFDCVMNVVEALEVDEAVEFVFRGET